MANIKAGLWMQRKGIDNLDGRTRLAKSFRAVKRDLVAALGGDPSPQQIILIDRAVFLFFRVSTYESMILNENKEAQTESVSAYYLSWVNSLRLILQSLGLERKAKNLDLAGALAELDREDQQLEGKRDGD